MQLQTPPETRYAPTSDGMVAWQEIGSGSRTILLIPDWLNPIEMLWEEPRAERFLTDLAGLGRLLMFDKRGSGVSDPIPPAGMSAGPTVELAAEDAGAVLDAAGAERATVIGIGCGCWPAILYAATVPARVERLVLVDGYPRLVAGEDYPAGLSEARAGRFVDWIVAGHGTGELLRLVDPAAHADPDFRRWYGRCERLSMCPKWMRGFWSSISEINVGPALSSVAAPTLVLNRRESRAYPVERGRYLAQGIQDAELRELPGGDELYYMTNPSPLLAEVREFLTGVREAAEIDRILATVLFVDIVDSTRRLAEIGDRGWRDELLRHRRLVRQELARFRGHEVDTAGDGLLATFDGPARAIRCAQAIRDGVRRHGMEIRVGIHVGECELVGEKIGGIAVHTASRVMGAADPGEILVSRTVKDLVAGSGLAFDDRGTHALRGVPGSWQLFALQEG